MNRTRRINWNKDETGAASIVITLIMIIVISLLVLGFAQISRREQRLSLDRQLSTQAFYAAESGVNDALKVIKDNSYLTLFPGGKTNCGSMGITDPLYSSGDLSKLDPAGTVKYSCLLINPAPQSIKFQLNPIDPNKEAQVVPLHSIDGAGNGQSLDELKIEWTQSPASSTDFVNCPATNSFPQTWPASNCATGMLRVDIVPNSAISNRNNLETKTETLFLQPNVFSAEDLATYNIATMQGKVIPVNCLGSTHACHETIKVGLGENDYYLRVKALYSPAAVTISATHGHTGTPTNLQGVQALIDSTGKAQDVLRRIEVHVPLNKQNGFPNYAIQSTDTICKRLSINPDNAVNWSVDPFFFGAPPPSCFPD